MNETQGSQAHSALVIGEALIDIVSRDGTTVEHVGGSPANVAVGLARLGVEAHLLTQIGRDERGRLIAEHLRDADVHLLPDSWSDAPTSTATATLAPDGSARYEFSVQWDAPSPPAVRTPIVHAGSIALFVQPGGDAVADHLESISGSSVVTIDPNIRPALIGARETAVAQFERIARNAHVVKMSDEDSAWLYPGTTAREALERVVALGVRAAFVTCGGEGAIGALDGELFSVDAFPVTVVDTIGAGDAFMSSLIRSAAVETNFWSPEGARRAALEAAAAAALTVAVAGANPPSRSSVEELVASLS